MKILKWVGILVVLLVVVAVVGINVITSKAEARLAKTWDIPAKDIPVPFPLSEAELAELRAEKQPAVAKADPAEGEGEKASGEAEPAAEKKDGDAAATDGEAAAEAPAHADEKDPLEGMDLDKLALERAVKRGDDMVNNLLGCFECHGEDYGGKVIMDNPPMGRWVAPNITSAGITKDFKSSDWVRILRHGVNHKKQSATMPAIDYTNLSDRELSDIIAYVKSKPPVERELPEEKLGPIRAMLISNGGIPVSAELIDHKKERAALPPATQPTKEYGAHLAQACVGCHRLDWVGGPVPGGDPSWPHARNLTPHESGLKGWTKDDFFKALREGKRPDGSDVKLPMPWQAYKGMEDAQIEALYMHFMSLPPAPTGT
jgi:mono/diheme cytochrome c family protein